MSGRQCRNADRRQRGWGGLRGGGGGGSDGGGAIVMIVITLPEHEKVQIFYER